MAQEILINVPLDHTKKVTIEVNGVKGEGCEKLTAALEEALGEVSHREHKDEYYEREERVRDRQRQ